MNINRNVLSVNQIIIELHTPSKVYNKKSMKYTLSVIYEKGSLQLSETSENPMALSPESVLFIKSHFATCITYTIVNPFIIRLSYHNCYNSVYKYTNICQLFLYCIQKSYTL